MKISVASILVFSLTIFVSCKDKSVSSHLLSEAKTIIEDEPRHALKLLDSIHNPEDMDKDSYMQYVVAHVQAKYRLYKDITRDTLIFDAQEYFNQKKNVQESLLADYYAGGVYREKKIFDRALENFLKAESHAIVLNNNLYIGKSLHNIADLYFEQDNIKEAIVNYQKALGYYEKVKGTDKYRFQTITRIGRSYEGIGNLDSACFYFSKGLDQAIASGDKINQSFSRNNLGVVLHQKKDYAKAKEFLQAALPLTTSPEDSLRIFLNLSKVYNSTNRLDSAKYYTEYVERRLSITKDNYLLKIGYGALADYNKQTGNYKEQARYLELQKETDQKISSTKNAEELTLTENKYKARLEEEALANRYNTLLVIVISVALIVILILYFVTCNTRMKNRLLAEEKKKLEAENELVRLEERLLMSKAESLTFFQSLYDNAASEWVDIEKKVKALTEEYGATEEPELYLKIKEMVISLQQKINLKMIAWIKDYLLKQPNGDKALEVLDDRDLLLVALCYCKCKTKVTAAILGMAANKDHLDAKRYKVRNKLVKAGFPRDLAEEIMFGT